MNIAKVFRRNALRQPSTIAVESGASTFSYAEFDILVRRLAHGLRVRGINTGDLVGVRMQDSPQHLAAFLAIAYVGAIILPLDWRSALPELERITARLPPKAIINDSDAPLPGGLSIISIGELEAEPPDSRPAASVENAPLVYGLTSGTTGEPKGLVLTHEQLFGRFVVFSLEELVARNDRFLASLPLAFDAGRCSTISLICLGGTLVMYPTLFDPGEFIDFVARSKASVVMVTPNVTRKLLGVPVADGQRLMPNLRRYISTAGKLTPEERAEIRNRIASPLVDYYGTTGGGPNAIIANAEDGASPTAVGRPALSIEAEIVDEDYVPLPEGETGRVRLRGPGVTTAFVGTIAPDSDEGLRDGWYYPGDLGSLDANGLLHVTGRMAELIKRGGQMVHAQEVEYILRLHPAIVDAAVVGIPSPDLGEEVVAFITASEPVTLKALTAHCRSQLAGYKIPRRFELVDAFPRNTSGKVIKAELRKWALETDAAG